MAWVFGGKHFGQYTYEHWFDDEFAEAKSSSENQNEKISGFPDAGTNDSSDNTDTHKPQKPQ